MVGSPAECRGGALERPVPEHVQHQRAEVGAERIAQCVVGRRPVRVGEHDEHGWWRAVQRAGRPAHAHRDPAAAATEAEVRGPADGGQGWGHGAHLRRAAAGLKVRSRKAALRASHNLAGAHRA
jgi:hypothetical protein